MITAIGLTILAGLYFAFYKWGYKHGERDALESRGLTDQPPLVEPPPPLVRSDYD